MLSRLRTIAVASLLLAAPAAAQQAAPRADSSGVPLEARVRQRVAAVVKQRLGLTDDQMRQLSTVNASFEGRRRDLLLRERQSRAAIRAELLRGTSADQKKVETLLGDLFRAQRERIDIAEQEQRELAKFMQPSQRAGYLALQEQLRRRIEEMRRKRENRSVAAGRRGGPGR
ncbi:MAG TPA: hypothetical protein VHM30_00500 [Gemmatimonadaceae bacterium]|nr:hypothetical protein [Gemmatimonadaceae bacterium]